jgi:very-long-chain (3R)-3-hydroxyacyl-CoA dehydratase
MAHPNSATWRTRYLTTYNIGFTTLWSSVFVLTTANLFAADRTALIKNVEPRARWIQTLSLLDVLHSATRLIPAPLGSTFTQVVTRVIQVWLIWFAFPQAIAASHAFPALLLAWSVADAVRYAYLALNLHGKAPGWLVWLRYSMFLVLYPVGIGAEWWLMYRAIAPARAWSWVLPPMLYVLLALYVPGEWSDE